MILLGLATVGTAWCGLQASLWNGDQGDLANTSAARLFGQHGPGQGANGIATHASHCIDVPGTGGRAVRHDQHLPMTANATPDP